MEINKMGSFAYTKCSGILTEEQRIFYEENGYLLFKKLVSDAVLDNCRQTFLDICNNLIETGAMIVMKEQSLRKTDRKGEFLINKIQDFLFNEDLFRYASYEPMVDIIEDIIGPNITAMHSMLINKPPDASENTSQHPMHQDLHYFPFRPASSIVASWTAMEKVNKDNGCLFICPGTHKMELQPHMHQTENFVYHGVKGFDHLPKIFVEMEKGDTVFFHPCIFHGSGPNLTKGFRKAISVHFADSNCKFIDVRGTSQEHVANEVEQMMKKKGYRVPYSTLWKAKSRLVRGAPGNFQNIHSQL